MMRQVDLLYTVFGLKIEKYIYKHLIKKELPYLDPRIYINLYGKYL